jgi:hypothetical protein
LDDVDAHEKVVSITIAPRPLVVLRRDDQKAKLVRRFLNVAHLAYCGQLAYADQKDRDSDPKKDNTLEKIIPGSRDGTVIIAEFLAQRRNMSAQLAEGGGALSEKWV